MGELMLGAVGQNANVPCARAVAPTRKLVLQTWSPRGCRPGWLGAVGQSAKRTLCTSCGPYLFLLRITNVVDCEPYPRVTGPPYFCAQAAVIVRGPFATLRRFC